MCYFSEETYRKSIKGIFLESEIQRIASLFFGQTIQLIVGCGTEPTLYKNFISIIELAKKFKVPFVGLTTNGQLLTREGIQRLAAIGLDELTISVHGVQQGTYESFMVNASYNKLHEVLRTVEEARGENIQNKPYLRINYTVNTENLEELSKFFQIFGCYSINTIQIRPIIDIGGRYRTVLGPNEFKRYHEIISQLSEECTRRRIILLANIADPSYNIDGYSSVILPAVRRYISPQVVWMPEFEWKTETMNDFYQRIKWGRQLLRNVIASKEEIMKNAGHRHAARYDVFG